MRRMRIRTVATLVFAAAAGRAWAETKDYSVLLVGPREPNCYQHQRWHSFGARSIEAYTSREAQRVFREHRQAEVVLNVKLSNSWEVDKPVLSKTVDADAIVVGTPEDNPLIAQLLKEGFIEPETHAQGYVMRCAPNPKNSRFWLLAIAGVDKRGALYGLRDLEHYELKHFSVNDGRVIAEPFVRRDYPRIEYRGHWIWGCNMPDKKAWLENMSRWKLNELIHWDNYPPKKAREYVDFAHDRGIRIIWAFGWGWIPDWNFRVPPQFVRGKGQGVLMCGSSEFNRKFFREEILKKIREDYAPTGCDGIYFQSFTECPKCQCDKCRDKTMGQLLVEFVNPIVSDIKKEFPDLWISCGVHANFGNYSVLKDLDPRCNIMWENCDSATSVRGEGEDFGYILKGYGMQACGRPAGHNFSRTCPADPPWTEDSLRRWMASNAQGWRINGPIEDYYAFMQTLQGWGANFLNKKSDEKHASTVAGGIVFCRRTPFKTVALAEAMWNPDRNTQETVDALLEFLLPDVRKEFERLAAAAIVRHDAVGKKISLANKYAPQYGGGGDSGLINGRRAVSEDPGDPEWQGYEGADLDAVVDLGKSTPISSLSSNYLHSSRPGIFLPKQVEYALSDDGKTFRVVGTLGNDIPENIPLEILEADNVIPPRKTFALDGLDAKARYVRVRAKNFGVIPGSDKKTWLFADEIMVNPAEAK